MSKVSPLQLDARQNLRLDVALKLLRRWPIASILRPIEAIWRDAPQSFLALRGIRRAGRTESQVPLTHESDFRSSTWRMVHQHRQPLGNRAVSHADYKLELRSGQSQSFLSRQLPAPGLCRQWQRESHNRKYVQYGCIQCNSCWAGGKLRRGNPGGTWHRYDRGWVVQDFPSHGTDADAL
jgi:hypothetical protein